MSKAKAPRRIPNAEQTVRTTIDWRPIEDLISAGTEVVFACFAEDRAICMQHGYAAEDYPSHHGRATVYRDRAGNLLPFTPTHYAFLPWVDKQPASTDPSTEEPSRS